MFTIWPNLDGIIFPSIKEYSPTYDFLYNFQYSDDSNCIRVEITKDLIFPVAIITEMRVKFVGDVECDGIVLRRSWKLDHHHITSEGYVRDSSRKLKTKKESKSFMKCIRYFFRQNVKK